jgi:hypothetical protein
VDVVNIEYSIDNGVTWTSIVTASVENYKIQNTNYKQITNKVAPFGQVLNAFGEKGTHELHELTRIKGGHGLQL